MKLLLDTHVLLRVLTNDSKLSDKARRLIADESNEIFYSVISAWEIEIKHEKHPTQ
ncbi:MAG: PIN domain-containing protein, partial [Clostridia bacterium]